MKIIFENKQRLVEDKVVKFGGQTFPKFGWCVILMGGGGSGKGTAFNSLIPIEGAYLNVDNLKENPKIWDIQPAVRDKDTHKVVRNNDGQVMRYENTYKDRIKAQFEDGPERNLNMYTYMGKMDTIAPGEKIKGIDPYDPKLKGKDTYVTGQGRDRLKVNLNDPTATGYIHSAVRDLGKAWKQGFYDNVGAGADASRLPNVIFDIQADELKDIQKITSVYKPKGYKIAIVWMLSTINRALKNNAGRGRTVDPEILINAHRKVINTANELFSSGYITNIDEFWVINTNTSNRIFDKKYSKKAGKDLYHDAQNCFQVPTTANGLDTFMAKYNENPYWSKEHAAFDVRNRMKNQLQDIPRQLAKRGFENKQ